MMKSSVVVSSSSSTLIDDYVGMESCFDLDNNEDPCGGGCGVDCSQSRAKREQRCRTMMKRDIPPPIPSLARNDNLPCHMPWVLKRYYTSDGRLILKEEKVRFNEYFRANRSNGRLILHLVPFNDNNDEIDHKEAKVDDEEAHVNDFDNETDDINNGEDDDDDSSNNTIVETLLKDNEFPVIEHSIVKCSIAESPLENGIAANGGKCLKYSSVRASPTCFLGLPVPAIRSVHS